jgi:hypothetical protein
MEQQTLVVFLRERKQGAGHYDAVTHPRTFDDRTRSVSTPQVVEAEIVRPSTSSADQTADVNPKRATALESDRVPPAICATGNLLLVPRGLVLPARCVKCGNASSEPWPRITFSWHHPGYYCFIISPILYAIVALIVRKTIKLSVPLCKAHKSIRKKRLLMATVLLIGCIPLPTALGVYVGNDNADIVAICLGIAMFISGLFFLAFASPMKPTRISSVSAEFQGVCPEFLAGLNEVTLRQTTTN